LTFIAAVVTPSSVWLAIRAAFTPLEMAAVLFTLINVWLAIKEKIWTWPAGIASVLLYLVVFWRSHLYLNAGLQIVYFVMSIHGWYEWLHGGVEKISAKFERLLVLRNVFAGVDATIKRQCSDRSQYPAEYGHSENC